MAGAMGFSALGLAGLGLGFIIDRLGRPSQNFVGAVEIDQ